MVIHIDVQEATGLASGGLRSTARQAALPIIRYTIIPKNHYGASIAFFCLVFTSVTSAADWPHVRGLSYDAISHETGLADHWPEAGPPVLWTRELGPGYSAFIVAEGRAFTLFQATGGIFLIALDVDTGAEIWKERVDWPWQAGGVYPGPYASPTWWEGKVYYATPTGLVGCARAADGRSLWTVNVREKFGSRGTEFGYASTPLVEDGRVVLPVGGPKAAMVALSSRTPRFVGCLRGWVSWCISGPRA